MVEPIQPPTVRDIRADGHAVIATFADGRILTLYSLEKDGSFLGLHHVVIENPRSSEGRSGICLAFFQGQNLEPRDTDFSITQIAGGFRATEFQAYWEAVVAHLRSRKPEEADRDAISRDIVLHPVSLVCLRLVQLGRCGFRA